MKLVHSGTFSDIGPRRVVRIEDAANATGPKAGVVVEDGILADELMRRGVEVAISRGPCPTAFRGLWVGEVDSANELRPGDVVLLNSAAGRLRTVFRPDSDDNALFLTERCDNFCLMCSQPPRDVDDEDLVPLNIDVIRLMTPSPTRLGVTGGEPMLQGMGVVSILKALKEHHPNCHVYMLTNGRAFCQPPWAELVAAEAPTSFICCVPLYSAIAAQHDFVVQARDAFQQTMIGIHELSRHGVAIEIRVVLHKETISDLQGLVRYICRNLPFTRHVALMGLEPTGFARAHHRSLWLDPFDYSSELKQAVRWLVQYGMDVSVYNHPLCVMDEWTRRYAACSISDWKREYMPECDDCALRGQCGGLFRSSRLKNLVHVQPIPADEG